MRSMTPNSNPTLACLISLTTSKTFSTPTCCLWLSIMGLRSWYVSFMSAYSHLRLAKWCDVGVANNTLEFAAQFYNNAMENGYQVTLNDRVSFE